MQLAGLGSILTVDEFFECRRHQHEEPQSPHQAESLTYCLEINQENGMEKIEENRCVKHGIQVQFQSCKKDIADQFARPSSYVKDAATVETISLDIDKDKGGAKVRVVAGQYGSVPTSVQENFVLLDIMMRPGSKAEIPVQASHGLVIYILEIEDKGDALHHLHCYVAHATSAERTKQVTLIALIHRANSLKGSCATMESWIHLKSVCPQNVALNRHCANDDTPMLVNCLVTRLQQAMANLALQGEVQQKLHAYGLLPTHQEERAPKKSLGETSKRGLHTTREGENPYQELRICYSKIHIHQGEGAMPNMKNLHQRRKKEANLLMIQWKKM
ncbi:hypothetical protein L7F22_033648 [Adiantum nelumboides]|nr:hypothetical protein [Adiantum nelumboides]